MTRGTNANLFRFSIRANPQAMECLQYLHQSQALSDVEGAALDRIAEVGRIQDFAPHQLIYVSNERPQSLCLLLAGRVALGQFSKNGKRAWLMLVDSGETFGEQSLLQWDRQNECAETFESSKVLFVSARLIKEMLPMYPRLAMAAISLLGQRLKTTQERWQAQFFRSTRERLITVLWDLSQKYGHQVDRRIEISIDLSHEDLAGFVGSTRETVSLEISRLKREGLMHSSRRRLTLYNPECWLPLLES